MTDGIKLAHRLRVRTLAAMPHGRGVIVFLDGHRFDEIERLNVTMTPDNLHMVTLTFPASVVVEEISEDQWAEEPGGIDA